MKRIRFVADPHLNKTSSSYKERFFRLLFKESPFRDYIVFLGDIGEGIDNTIELLEEIENELHVNFSSNEDSAPTVLFLLGNHDFYSNYLRDTEKAMLKWNSSERRVVKWLTQEGVVKICGNEDICIIGVDGWYDAKYGIFKDRFLRDYDEIPDYSQLSNNAIISLIRHRANQYANIADTYIEKAVSENCKNIIFCSHMPIYEIAAVPPGRYGEIQDEAIMPHFTSKSLGDVVKKHAKNKDVNFISVAGHTHGDGGPFEVERNIKAFTVGAHAERDFSFPHIGMIVYVDDRNSSDDILSSKSRFVILTR